jgi:hypothetical protein
MAPRPIQRLRPMVTCPTFKYNVKKRAGRWGSLDQISLLPPDVFISALFYLGTYVPVCPVPYMLIIFSEVL